MLALLIILAFTGLLQSFFELRKDEAGKYQKRFRKGLSYLYVIIFIIGVVVVIWQQNENRDFSQLMNRLTSTVDTIYDKVSDQFDTLDESLEQTKTLVLLSDSMNNNMTEIMEIRDSLLVQSNLINEKLAQQLRIEQQSLEGKAAVMDLADGDSKWIMVDSITFYLEICIQNFGRRNAVIDGGEGYAVFFDKKNRPVYFTNFYGSTVEQILPPSELQRNRLCYNSQVVKRSDSFKSVVSFAVICLRIKYRDVLSSDGEMDYLYSGWVPDVEDFGGLEDWQVNLAKSWAKEHFTFSD